MRVTGTNKNMSNTTNFKVNFEHDGKQYQFKSKQEALRQLCPEVSLTLLSKRLSRGWSMPEAFNLEPRDNSEKNIKFEYKDVVYKFDSLKKAMSELGIKDDIRVIRQRLSAGWTHAEVLGIKPRGAIQFEYNGKEYGFNSYEAAAKHFNVNIIPSTILQRVNTLGWTVPQALELEDRAFGSKHKVKFKYRGVEFSFATKTAAEEFSIYEKNELTRRLNSGMKPEKAMGFDNVEDFDELVKRAKEKGYAV